jgi:hypothetical protein
MEQVAETTAAPSGFDVGRWLGQRDAFAVIAGRCSAAQAECLRRIRDEKLYLSLEPNWEDFCSKRLGASRRNIDRFLSRGDEFGLAYYHVAQMTHVTPEEYRAIAPHISDEGVRWEGAVIALLPENREQVTAAVAGLLEREKPAKEKAPLSFGAILKRCDALTEAVERMTRQLEPVEAMRLTNSISRLRVAAGRKGAQTL